jgi:hypothetical protein
LTATPSYLAAALQGKPCWKIKGANGLAYRDSRRVRFGITSIKLTAGTGGTAKIQLKAQGGFTALPALPLAVPTRVQLISENGACFESVFSSTGATRNDAAQFQGKAD